MSPGSALDLSPMAVAIVNYNTREHLRACLETVRAEAPGEVVVVDNASSDGSAEMVRETYPGAVLHANRTNAGYGAAANQAIASCRAGYVLLLNADTRLERGTLHALTEYLDLHPRAAVVGPRLANPDGTLQPSCYPFPTPLNTLLVNGTLSRLIGRVPVLRDHHLRSWPHSRARAVPCVLGAALAIRREPFSAIGGFDESFFMYFEEVDLCFRLASGGWEAHFAPVTTIIHAGGASTNQCRAGMAVEHATSLVRFYERHYSRTRRLLLLGILKSIMLVRLIVDGAHFCMAREEATREGLAENVVAWRRLLLGRF